ncbi:hypothetical protein [Salinibacterium sp. SWN1162]|uniref:hypothetical protein n=1 Tax=Salinibacterium sp. SWN1162 TaxID=2792053 RepID=UPI0018CDE5DD|nr:hypothetical protein [Salinibacterium sp. SWN1162]MBH0008115.1 hypothetical protein [Salinibacterium sp. SWN1162]
MSTFGDSGSRTARLTTRRIIATASAALVALVLAGCTNPVGEGVLSFEPTATPVESTPAPVAEPLVIPSCEELLPLSQVAQEMGDTTELLRVENTGEFELAWPGRYEGFEDFLAEVPLSQQCTWAPTGSFEVFVELMVADTSNTDLDALRAHILESGYVAAENGGVETYTGQAEGSSRDRFPTHLLVDDLWIYVTPYSQELALSHGNGALEQIAAANPTRGY